MTLSAFLTDIGNLVSAAVSWMTTIWNFIVSDPILVVLVLGIPLVGLGVGLLTRLFRVS